MGLNTPVKAQYLARVPDEERISGWLYDYHSGVCMGIASDELKVVQPRNAPFKQNISGCPHTLIIHP